VYGVFATEAAVLVHFKAIRGIFFVLGRVVISLLAFVASERDFDSHSGAS